jgi:hypothetical protein
MTYPNAFIRFVSVSSVVKTMPELASKYSPRDSARANVSLGMNDPRDPLSSTLQSWRHEPTPAPDFNHQVWARIRAADHAPARRPFAFLHRHALPLAASVAVILSILAGSGSAFALNHTRTTQRMAAAYVRSIDPVQMTATSAPHVHP